MATPVDLARRCYTVSMGTDLIEGAEGGRRGGTRICVRRSLTSDRLPNAYDSPGLPRRRCVVPLRRALATRDGAPAEPRRLDRLIRHRRRFRRTRHLLPPLRNLASRCRPTRSRPCREADADPPSGAGSACVPLAWSRRRSRAPERSRQVLINLSPSFSLGDAKNSMPS